MSKQANRFNDDELENVSGGTDEPQGTQKTGRLRRESYLFEEPSYESHICGNVKSQTILYNISIVGSFVKVPIVQNRKNFTIQTKNLEYVYVPSDSVVMF